MTEQTRAPSIPFAPPLGLLNPFWPAYGLMMGASLHWWALSRLVQFASPAWAFDSKPTLKTPVLAPPTQVEPAEAAPVAQAEGQAYVEPAPESDPAPEAAPSIAAEPAAAAEAAFAPEIETFFAPERPVEPTPELMGAAAPEPTPEPVAEAAAELTPEPVAEAAAELTPEPVAAAAPEPTAELEAAAAAELTVGPGDVDELTLIRGVGPRVADALVERGVTTFRQLAQWTEKDMHHFDVEMKLLGRSKRYDFLGQAKALASEA